MLSVTGLKSLSTPSDTTVHAAYYMILFSAILQIITVISVSNKVIGLLLRKDKGQNPGWYSSQNQRDTDSARSTMPLSWKRCRKDSLRTWNAENLHPE